MYVYVNIFICIEKKRKVLKSFLAVPMMLKMEREKFHTVRRPLSW
jgi:hypothetical protein